MKALWRRYAERIDALSLRERVMVFAAAAVVLLAPAWALFIDAEGAKQKRLVAALKQKQSEMKALEAQVAQLFGAHAGGDPTTERLLQIRRELTEAEAQVTAEERKFTAPSQMRAVIGELLARNRAVSLLELRTLPVTSIAEARATGGKPAPASERLIYRHGIELTVAGAYLDLLAYLRDLESLPTTQLYWGALEIDAVGYPKVTMKLTVYTLSLDRTWLKV